MDRPTATGYDAVQGGMPMRRFRISIAGLMATVVYLCFALATLSRPMPLWGEAWLTCNLASLAVAVIGAIYSPTGRRPFWGGFAIVGWGFVALYLFPAYTPRLVTDSLAEWCYGAISYTPAADESVWVLVGEGFYKGRLIKRESDGTYQVRSDDPRVNSGSQAGITPAVLRPISPIDYQQLWHSMLALPVAAAGGLVARTFAGRDRREPPSNSGP